MTDLFKEDIAHMIHEHFRITSTSDSILEFSDLMSITLRGHDIQQFDTKWDKVLSCMREAPKDDILNLQNKTKRFRQIDDHLCCVQSRYITKE